MKVNSTSLIFWAIALILGSLFWATHWMGFRSYTSILAGVNSGEEWTHLAGFLYLSLYVMWISVVPIFVLAGALLWVVNRIVDARSSETSST